MIVGIKCPLTDKNETFDSCLECKSKNLLPCSFTETYLKWLKRENATPHNFPSVTTLTGCLRSIFLQRATDRYINPTDSLYLFRGCGTHKELEGVSLEDKDCLTEYAVEIKLGDRVLKGKLDKYIISKKKLVDYKTIKTIYKKYLPKWEHVYQVNMYRLGLEQKGYPVDTQEVEYYAQELAPGDPMLSAKAKKITNKTLIELANETLNIIETSIESQTIPPYNLTKHPLFELSDKRDNSFEWMCKDYCPVYNECMSLLKEGK